MDQLSTFLTFTMIAVFMFFPMISDIFKTGTALTVYYILRGQTFFHHLLQMTVNGRGSDGNPFFPEKIADFIHGNMSSLYRFQEGKYFGHLFCFIWCFCYTDLLPSIWKSFSFYHIIFICQWNLKMFFIVQKITEAPHTDYSLHCGAPASSFI